DGATGELRTLAEGSVSPIQSTFVAVVRDAEIYATLRSLAANLPELNADFFGSNVVIAAFLGERHTRGYSIAISRNPDGKIRVAEKAPSKGTMVPQMITSPFKLVSIATDGTSPVPLLFDETFQKRAQLYRIRSGMFTILGGIAGRSDTYHLAGKIQALKLGALISIGFAIASEGTPRERMLRDFVTGRLSENGFELSRLNHGSLIDPPSGDLQVSGEFSEKHSLLLDLTTGPATVPDGYSGKGRLEAARVSASAN